MEYKFNIPRLGSLSGLNQALSTNSLVPDFTMPNSNMMNMNNLNQSLEIPKNLYDPSVQLVRPDQIPEYSKFGNLMAGSEFTRTPEQLAQMTQTEFAQFDQDRKDARNTRLGMMLQALSNSLRGEATDPQDLLAMKENSRIAKERARMKKRFEEDLKYMNPEMKRKAQLLGAEGYAEVLKQNMIDSFSNKKSTAQKNVASLVEAQANFSRLNNLSEEEKLLMPDYKDQLERAQTELVGLQTAIGTDAYATNLAEIKRKNEAPGGLDLTTFEKKYDEKISNEIVDWETTGKAKSDTNLKNIADKVNTLREGSQDVSGPITGLIADSETFGPFLRKDAVNFQADVNDYVFQSLKDKLGAQFTEREGRMLVKAAFNNRLPEEMNIQRLERLLQSGIMVAESKNAMSRYLQENGTMKGYVPEQEFSMASINAYVLGLPQDIQNYDNDQLEEYILRNENIDEGQAEYLKDLIQQNKLKSQIK